MTEYCQNCGADLGDQAIPQNWEGVCPACGQLAWIALAPGCVVKGVVSKITPFGVFVRIGEGVEGLLHVSELADKKVAHPSEVVKLGDEIDVKVLLVDFQERKIGLSRKRVDWSDDHGTNEPWENRPSPAPRCP